MKWCISITFLSRKPIHAVWPTLYQQECISHFISIYFHQKGRCNDPFFITNRGSSSSGRAFGSQSKGSGFESHLLHKKRKSSGSFFFLCSRWSNCAGCRLGRRHTSSPIYSTSPPSCSLIPNCSSFLLSPRLLLANYLLFSLFNSKFCAKSWLVQPEAMQPMRPPYSSTGHRVSLLCKRKFGGWVTQIL